MIKVLKSLQMQGSIVSLYTNNDFFFFINTTGKLTRVHKTSGDEKSFLLVSDNDTPLHPFHKGASFGKNNKVVFSYSTQGSSGLYTDLPTEIENTLVRPTHKLYEKPRLLNSEPSYLYGHDQRCEVLKFAGVDGNYIFSGGTDGKIYMHNVETGSILMSLRAMSDYISHITLNEKGSYLAYSSYNKSLIVLNLRQQKRLFASNIGHVIEDSIFYNNSNALYAISREGVSYTIDLKNGAVDKKALFPTWPSTCILEKSGRFAIVGTRGGHLHFIKLANNTLFATFKLDHKGVTSLHIDESILYIGFETGWVQTVDMYAYIDDFTKALSNKYYQEAKTYLDQNIFISIHPISEMFQDAWEEILKQITEQLASGNAAKALEFATPFMTDTDHKNEFKFFLQKQKEFEKFSQLVTNGNVFEAYALLEKYPFLSKTQTAQQLEKYFTKAFNEAKRLLSDNPLLNKPKAVEALKAFANIPAKKEIISLLMKNHLIFVQSSDYIKEKKFKEYFQMSQAYPLLTEESIYAQICAIAQNGITKVKKSMDEHRFEDALSGIKQLVPFLPYKGELSLLLNHIQLRQNLLRHIDANEIEEVYSLINLHPELSSIENFRKYDEKFEITLMLAMGAVGRGDIKETQAILSPYAKFSIFKSKIKECIRQASLNQLEILLKISNIAAATTISAFYLKEFGKDDEYERLLKKIGNNTDRIAGEKKRSK